MATTTTTQSNPFYDIVAPYLPDTFKRAEDLYTSGAFTPAYYPGETVAGLDPVRAQGINLAVQAGLGPQQQLADTYAQQIQGIATGSDPYTQKLATQAGSAASGGFGTSGALGGARHAAAATQAASNTVANRQLDALSRIRDAQAAQLAPSQTLTAAGQDFEGYQQSLIDADRQRYAYNVGLPAQGLQAYQTALGFPGVASSAPNTSVESKQASGLEKATGILGLATGAGKLFGLL